MIRLHDLRHTRASLLLGDGEPVRGAGKSGLKYQGSITGC